MTSKKTEILKTRKFKSVMLIDDDETTNFIHRKLLEKMNVSERIQTFVDPVEALNYLRLIDDEPSYYPVFAPELILLDIQMPLMDGFKFLSEYEKMKIFKQKPIELYLLSSLDAMFENKKESIENICSGFIKKPLSGEKLLNVINRK